MFKLTLKSLLDRKIRLALTTFAVVLGVAFVSGSFILADSLRATFDEIGDEIAGPVDARIVGEETVTGDAFSRGVIPASVGDIARNHPDVLAVSEFVQFPLTGFSIGDNFETAITARFAPLFAGNWDAPVTAFEILEGEPPGPNQVLVDLNTAADNDISIGDQIQARGQVTSVAEVSGIIRFGQDNGAGAQFLLFDLEGALRLGGLDDERMVIDVQAREGVSDEELTASLNEVLPEGIEAITGAAVAEDFSSAFDDIVGIFQNVLLAFALVALVVSAFIINNTFSIVLGQRIKELGLLRILGATGRQVRQSVIIEALIIGLLASVIGAIAGLGVAALINWAISQGGDGNGLPSGPLVIGLRTWIAALFVGVGITLASSISPARKAASIPPIAAITDGLRLTSGGTRRRTITGASIAVLGGVLVVVGSTSDGGAAAQLGPLGAGALLLFVAISALSPLIARPIALALGKPIARFRKMPGVLARENAARNPRRTASTASALMVGLALVSTVLVIGNSFKKTFTSILDNSLVADLFIEVDGGRSFVGFSPDLVDGLNELDEIELAVGFSGGDQVASAVVAGDRKWITATQEEGLGTMVDLDLQRGSYSGLSDGGLLVHEDPASDLSLAPGDVIDVTFPEGVQSLTVVGIYRDSALAGNWVVSKSTFAQAYDGTFQLDLFAAASIADGVDPDVARAAADGAVASFPEASLQDRDEFQETLENRIDQLLLTVNLMLLFAIAIAILGIINTLVLSVFERTREIGLLRAIGLTRAQTRSMIRWEAIIVAVFGGLLGILLGIAFGLIAIAAMPDNFITETGIPYSQFIVMMFVCGFAGVLAAIFPGLKAARLKVLDAISHV
ncbi:MAG: ABC transporter permease [Acidimicrobiales bacterium]